MSDFSESAITLGRVEAEFNYVVELLWDAGLRERTSELLRICSREGVNYKGFSYLETKLLGKEWAAQEQAKKDSVNWVESHGALTEEEE